MVSHLWSGACEDAAETAWAPRDVSRGKASGLGPDEELVGGTQEAG